MDSIKIQTKSNGYTAESIQPMISAFEKAAAVLFPGCTIEHFYYGDRLDMADIILCCGNYAHFNIYENRVSLCGYTLTAAQMKKCECLTYNDELYNGKLMELAGC